MRSLNDHIRFYLLLILIPILLFISAVDYYQVNENIETNFEKQRINAKESIEDSIRLIDNRNTVLSDIFSNQMEENSKPFLEAYNETAPNIEDIELNTVRNQMNWSMELDAVDLYIINRTGVIVNTTYKTDMGLDFKIFPNFYEKLQSIFESGEFTSDLITPETQTGKYRIFSYMPTPDGEYILEIGVHSEKLNYMLAERGYLKTVERLKDINPYLKDLRVFHYSGVLIGDPFYNTSDDVNEICLDVYHNKNNVTIREDGVKKEYFLIHLPHEEYPSEASKIVELSYDQSLMEQEIRQNAILHILMGALSVLIITVAVLFISKYITKPINNMIEEIDQITKKDSESNIQLEKETKIEELQILKESMNNLLNNLRKSIKELDMSKERERFLKSLLRQDTNNNLFVSIGFLQLIDRDNLSSEDKEYLDKAIESNKRVLDLVDLEKEVKRATKDEYVREVGLKSIFNNVAKEVNVLNIDDLKINIETEDQAEKIKAGHSIEKVISTLVKTCVRRGESRNIKLSGKIVGKKIRISIEDDGKRIPDDTKRKLENGQYTGGSSGIGGAIYFIAKEIIEIYGGELKINDSEMGGIRADIYLNKI